MWYILYYTITHYYYLIVILQNSWKGCMKAKESQCLRCGSTPGRSPPTSTGPPNQICPRRTTRDHQNSHQNHKNPEPQIILERIRIQNHLNKENDESPQDCVRMAKKDRFRWSDTDCVFTKAYTSIFVYSLIFLASSKFLLIWCWMCPHTGCSDLWESCSWSSRRRPHRYFQSPTCVRRRGAGEGRGGGGDLDAWWRFVSTGPIRLEKKRFKIRWLINFCFSLKWALDKRPSEKMCIIVFYWKKEALPNKLALFENLFLKQNRTWGNLHKRSISSLCTLWTPQHHPSKWFHHMCGRFWWCWNICITITILVVL